jgi:hypothetical protein
MKKLKLKNCDKFTLIDDEDFDLLNQFQWEITTNNYVRAKIDYINTKEKRVYLHRFLMKPPINKFVDHIDGNPLNNQKCNLRVCTARENVINSKRHGKYSKYKGVSYCSTEKRKKRWVAACEVNNKRITIGRYYTEKEAADAYNKKALELFGEFAKINKINEE